MHRACLGHVGPGAVCRRFDKVSAAVVLAFVLSACAGDGGVRHHRIDGARYAGLKPRIVSGQRSLQCVPYARHHSRIAIRGDAWTWWRKAAKRYSRGGAPRKGAVLVLKRKRSGRGHLAVVTRILGSREIVVSHANWLNRGRIHIDTPVRDVSRANDWSAVRVWYTPGNRFGSSTYPAYGFIYPGRIVAAR